ncbi:MAG: acyl-[acyl-carrier-protein] thioesterase, partial [Rhodothermales bacterium]
DMNRHTTFSRYALWAIETLPFETLQTHTLAELDLHFRAETVYGDNLRVATQQVETSETPASTA